MPTNAIDGAQVDYVARADEIGGLLDELVHRPAAESRSGRTSDLGGSKASDLVCPECGGVLREFDENGLARFHCRVGHNYSPEALFGAYDTRIEAAMWTAIRALEESASMARRLAFAANARGATQAARRFDDRERDAAERADLIRSGIMTLIGLDENPSIAEAEPVATEDERDRDEIREDALRIDAAS